jgi:hypothetical protein
MKLPILSYVVRYWYVLVAVVLTFILAKWDAAFALLDVFVYVPVCCAIAVAFVLLWRNIFNRGTTDDYVCQKTNRNDGTEVKQIILDFEGMTPTHRIWFTMIQSGFYLLGASIITAAIASNLFN